MLFNIINSRGDLLDLLNNEYVYPDAINGQTTAAADLSSVVFGSVDGDEVTNVHAQPRTIIIDLMIKSGVDVEEAKRAITRVVKIKKEITLLWEQNARKVEIKGIVESIDMPRWVNGVVMQISLHCSQPFWEDIDAIIQDINEALPLHYFTDYYNDMLYFPEEGIAFGEYDKSRTRKIHNAGDVDVGLQIEILAYDTVTNPILYDNNGNFFGVGYGTGNKRFVLNAGQILKISTVKGQKSVTVNGVSILGKVKPQSTWLQLAAGDNTFTINSDDASVENMTFALSYKQRYI